ncbi:MAG: sulfatase [Planctomycetota bacterium]|nr:sulfatase [Planctomycetota bacterium]
MRSPRPLPTAGLALAALLSTCGGSPVGPELAGAPVVLIVFDAMSAGHISHLGYPLETSPNLDALAADGVSFSAAFAPASYTLASIPSLFTGRLPDRHGVTQAEHILRAEEVTLAETLAARGYQTFGAIANIQGGPLHDLEQGFEVYEELFRVEEGTPGGHGMEIVPPERFGPVLEDWLIERDPTRPPFFYLHVLQPHMPYAPPIQHREGLVDPRYDGYFKDGMTREWMIEFAGNGGRIIPGTGPDKIPLEDATAVKGLYDGNIRYSDAQLGKLLDALRAVDLYDDALILVTSDHGESMWQHGYLGHSRQVFDEMVHVPLVVKFPKGAGVPPGQVSALTSLMDVYPSICAWMDLPAPGELDGQPLAGVLGGVEDPERELYLRSFHREPIVALRGRDHKALIEPDRDSEEERWLLFDLAADAAEKHPIKASDHPALARLAALRAELEALGPGAVRGEGPTAEESALIQELGYAE